MNNRNDLLHLLAVTLLLFLWGVGTTATDVSHSYDAVSLTEEAVVVVDARNTDDERDPVGAGGYQLV